MAIFTARALDPMEQLMVAFQHAFGNPVVVAAARIDALAAVPEALMISTTTKLQEAVPILAATIDLRDGEPDFLVPSAIEPIFVEAQNPLHEHIESEMARPLPESGPLWRLARVKEDGGACYLVLGAHHAICDGKTTTLLIEDFLTLLNHGSVSRAGPLSAQALVRPVLPPKEICPLAAKVTEPATAPPAAILADPDIAVPLDERRSAISMAKLTGQETAALVAACRVHSTTVTGALVAAFAASVFPLIGDEWSAMNVQVTADVRPFVSCPGTDVHKLYGNVYTSLAIRAEREEICLAAAHARERIIACLDSKQFLHALDGEPMAMKSLVRDLQEKVVTTHYHCRDFDSGVSNLGSPLRIQCGPYEVTEFWFSSSHKGGGPVFLLSAASTHSGMCLILDYSVPTISKDVADTVLQQCVDLLRSLLP